MLERGLWLYRGGQFVGGGNRSASRKPPTCRINLKYKVGVRELFSITPSENIPSTAG
jgi:hypothetical protein